MQLACSKGWLLMQPDTKNESVEIPCAAAALCGSQARAPQVITLTMTAASTNFWSSSVASQTVDFKYMMYWPWIPLGAPSA